MTADCTAVAAAEHSSMSNQAKTAAPGAYAAAALQAAAATTAAAGATAAVHLSTPNLQALWLTIQVRVTYAPQQQCQSCAYYWGQVVQCGYRPQDHQLSRQTLKPGTLSFKVAHSTSHSTAATSIRSICGRCNRG